MSLNTDGLPIIVPSNITGQEKAPFDTYAAAGATPQTGALTIGQICFLATAGQPTAVTAASGAVTVTTTKSTITTDKLTLTAGQTYTLTITDSSATATSRFYPTLRNGTNTTQVPLSELQSAAYIVSVTPASGSVVVVIGNVNATTALNGTVILDCVLL